MIRAAARKMRLAKQRCYTGLLPTHAPISTLLPQRVTDEHLPGMFSMRDGGFAMDESVVQPPSYLLQDESIRNGRLFITPPRSGNALYAPVKRSHAVVEAYCDYTWTCEIRSPSRPSCVWRELPRHGKARKQAADLRCVAALQLQTPRDIGSVTYVLAFGTPRGAAL